MPLKKIAAWIERHEDKLLAVLEHGLLSLVVNIWVIAVCVLLLWIQPLAAWISEDSWRCAVFLVPMYLATQLSVSWVDDEESFPFRLLLVLLRDGMWLLCMVSYLAVVCLLYIHFPVIQELMAHSVSGHLIVLGPGALGCSILVWVQTKDD